MLASGSPRRRELLHSLGIPFEAAPSSVEEEALEGEPASEQVERLALAKATEIATRFPGRWVLGADTIVVIDHQILGKPRDEDEAVAMLSRLANRLHRVFTGYALINTEFSAQQRIRHVCSRVRIRKLCRDQIAAYVATGEPMDKAGAYAIQGIGAGIVERVFGSYTNVVGLPLCEVAGDLKELGVFDFLAGNGRCR
jgi:septum formation protein